MFLLLVCVCVCVVDTRKLSAKRRGGTRRGKALYIIQGKPQIGDSAKLKKHGRMKHITSGSKGKKLHAVKIAFTSVSSEW